MFERTLKVLRGPSVIPEIGAGVPAEYVTPPMMMVLPAVGFEAQLAELAKVAVVEPVLTCLAVATWTTVVAIYLRGGLEVSSAFCGCLVRLLTSLSTSSQFFFSGFSHSF
jgi:hypothetical protein